MKSFARKLIALLLAVCLFAGIMPMVTAYDLQVAPINVQTSALQKQEGYEFLYQAATTMIDDLAEIVAIHKNRWDILNKLVWTCTLTDVLTARLSTDTLPEFYFVSCKLKGVDVFVPLNTPYVADGSIKLEYRLNPKLEALLKSSTNDEIKAGLTQTMEMALFDPKYATAAELEGIKTVHTTATIVMTNNDGSNLYYYNNPSALLAKGEADMTLPDIIIDPPPIDLDKNHDPFMRGYPDGTFKPEGSITRAEVAMMLYRRLIDSDDHGMTIPQMDEPDPNAKKVFADVEPDAWYGTAVYHLTEQGYIKGTNAGNYRPDEPITRAELCVMLVRFAHPEGEVTPQTEFEDVPKTHWAYDAIMTANAFGWVQGIGGNRFSPDRPITRTEAAKMFCVMLERYGDKLAASESMGREFPDVSTSHWGYMWIAEVTTRHEEHMMGDFEVWTKIYDFEGNLIKG
ncbi:MAG: S-layer homology domain-containing protein [Oscillospiraceae bacterium]|nr:S-layer homology domain-containing protein [Oscillospiraceae bacterium]